MVSALLNQKIRHWIFRYLGGYSAPVALLLPVMEAFSFRILPILPILPIISDGLDCCIFGSLESSSVSEKNYRQALLVSNLMNLLY